MPIRCHTCGQLHDDLPDVGADAPGQWYVLAEADRATRAELTRDTCIIDGQDHFIRGVIILPVIGESAAAGGRTDFGVGVWVSQAPQSFRAYRAHPDTAKIGPFFGWLCTGIRTYDPATQGLKTRARFQNGHRRPLIELEPTDHPLAVDQRSGISVARAWEIVHAYL